MATSDSSTEDSGNDEFIILTAGKAGVGKSTLINTFLQLHGTAASKAKMQPTSVTQSVKAYIGTVNGKCLKIYDIPGLHAGDHIELESDCILNDVKKEVKEIGAFFYCIRLIDRLDQSDYDNIKSLTKALGGEVWKKAIFVCTWADVAIAQESSLEKLLGKFASELHRNLIQTNQLEAAADIRSIYSFAAASYDDYDGIVCIPVSRETNIPPDWQSVLLKEVMRKCPEDKLECASPIFFGLTAEEILGITVAAGGILTSVALKKPKLALSISIGALTYLYKRLSAEKKHEERKVQEEAESEED